MILLTKYCRRVIWMKDESDTGYAIDFYHLMCHAIARETSSEIPQPCIYCQLDTDSDEYHDARFVPEQADQLENIYQALSRGAELNPDPVQDDEGQWICNEEDLDSLNAPQSATLAHLESVFQVPPGFAFGAPGQFDDAPEDQEMAEENGKEDHHDSHMQN